jgi:hypothetical protein
MPIGKLINDSKGTDLLNNAKVQHINQLFALDSFRKLYFQEVRVTNNLFYLSNLSINFHVAKNRQLKKKETKKKLE